MEKPRITLVDGTTITLQRPSMKMWRRVAEYDDMDKADWGFRQLMEEHAKMLAEMFGLDSPDNIDPADVLPMYLEAAGYIIGVANEKLKKLPNDETEKDGK